MMARLLRLVARFEEHWLADVLGVAALFALIPMGLFLAMLWGIK